MLAYVHPGEDNQLMPANLRSVETCSDCPLFVLGMPDREYVDIAFGFGCTPREFATGEIEHSNQEDVIMDLGHIFKINSDLAVALTQCAVRQVVTKDCTFSKP